jgi:hypothetical protein
MPSASSAGRARAHACVNGRTSAAPRVESECARVQVPSRETGSATKSLGPHDNGFCDFATRVRGRGPAERYLNRERPSSASLVPRPPGPTLREPTGPRRSAYISRPYRALSFDTQHFMSRRDINLGPPSHSRCTTATPPPPPPPRTPTSLNSHPRTTLVPSSIEPVRVAGRRREV